MRLGVRHTHSRPCLGGRFRCGAGGRGRRRSVGRDVARCTFPGSHTHIYTCRCGRWPRLLPLPRRARARSNAQPQRPSPPSSPSSTTYATPAVTHTHMPPPPLREREREDVCVCMWVRACWGWGCGGRADRLRSGACCTTQAYKAGGAEAARCTLILTEGDSAKVHSSLSQHRHTHKQSGTQHTDTHTLSLTHT
jgi:hypothetical protein